MNQSLRFCANVTLDPSLYVTLNCCATARRLQAVAKHQQNSSNCRLNRNGMARGAYGIRRIGCAQLKLDIRLKDRVLRSSDPEYAYLTPSNPPVKALESEMIPTPLNSLRDRRPPPPTRSRSLPE